MTINITIRGLSLCLNIKLISQRNCAMFRVVWKNVVLQKKPDVGHDYHRHLHALEFHFIDKRKLPQCPSFLNQFCLLVPQDARLWLKYVADNLYPDSKYTAIISRRVGLLLPDVRLPGHLASHFPSWNKCLSGKSSPPPSPIASCKRRQIRLSSTPAVRCEEGFVFTGDWSCVGLPVCMCACQFVWCAKLKRKLLKKWGNLLWICVVATL